MSRILLTRGWITPLIFLLTACIPAANSTTSGAAAASPIAKITQLEATRTPALSSTQAPILSPSNTPEPLTSTPSPATITPGAGAPIPADWSVYQNQQYGFSFAYPPDSQLVEDQPEHARIDLPFLPDTNLVEKYLEVDVLPLEVDQACSSPFAAGYDPQAVERETVEVSGDVFTRESGSEGAAGSTYTWVAYSTMNGEICASLTFIIHSGNTANYEVPPPEYDPLAEGVIFEQIVSTFQWME